MPWHRANNKRVLLLHAELALLPSTVAIAVVECQGQEHRRPSCAWHTLTSPFPSGLGGEEEDCCCCCRGPHSAYGRGIWHLFLVCRCHMIAGSSGTCTCSKSTHAPLHSWMYVLHVLMRAHTHARVRTRMCPCRQAQAGKSFKRRRKAIRPASRRRSRGLGLKETQDRL